MTRLRYNGVTAELGAALTDVAATITFATALQSYGSNIPTVSSPDYIPLSILDANGKVAEVVHLTAYTAGASTGTILRGQEGSTGVAHSSGVKVLHGQLAKDINDLEVVERAGKTLLGTYVADGSNQKSSETVAFPAHSAGDILLGVIDTEQYVWNPPAGWSSLYGQNTVQVAWVSAPDAVTNNYTFSGSSTFRTALGAAWSGEGAKQLELHNVISGSSAPELSVDDDVSSVIRVVVFDDTQPASVLGHTKVVGGARIVTPSGNTASNVAIYDAAITGSKVPAVEFTNAIYILNLLMRSGPTMAQRVTALEEALGFAASSSVHDDEFDASLSGWTTLGTPTTLDADTTVPGHLYIQPVVATGDNAQGVYKTPPAAPFTVTAKLSDALFLSNFNRAGLFIGPATPGAMRSVLAGYSGGDLLVGKGEAASPTGALTFSLTEPFTLGLPLYLRITVNSATDVDYLFSYGGKVWHELQTADDPGFTIGSVGLWSQAHHASKGGRSAWDWIRFE